MGVKALISPYPQVNPVVDKQFKLMPVWSKWFDELIYIIGRLINRYEPNKSGVAILAAGTKVVANTLVQSSSLIRLTAQNTGGTAGHLSVVMNPGTGFTINSTSNLDTRTIFYEIVEAF